LENKQVLIVSDSRNVTRFVNRSLASAGCSLEHCNWNRDQIVEQLALPYQMCIIDADSSQDEIRWLLEELYTNHQDTICLMVSHDHTNPLLRELLTTQNLNNVIAKHGGVSTTSELIDETELIVTCQKLFRRDIFGIDKYLSTWGIKVNEHEIGSTEDKRVVIGDLEDFLDQIDCYGAIKNAVLLVADELIMNAIFNAPRDDQGEPKYSNRHREQLKLEPGERVTFRYACDGRNVALSVSDQFGSLDREVIVKYLQRCFTSGPAEMEEKRAGAGLGLYMVFNSITQLTFNIQAGVSTEVIALFYVRSGARAFKASGRSLNIFVLKDDGEIAQG
jgi:hypothetical protein